MLANFSRGSVSQPAAAQRLEVCTAFRCLGLAMRICWCARACVTAPSVLCRVELPLSGAVRSAQDAISEFAGR